jgi:hypothetical protein
MHPSRAAGATRGGGPKSYKKPKPKPAAGDDTAAAGAPKGFKPQAYEYRTPDGVPGLNKIKAAIRQTSRMLKRVSGVFDLRG